jgi:hypothetical protein
MHRINGFQFAKRGDVRPVTVVVLLTLSVGLGVGLSTSAQHPQTTAMMKRVCYKDPGRGMVCQWVKFPDEWVA